MARTHKSITLILVSVLLQKTFSADSCVQNVSSCVPLQSKKCLGATLGFGFTSIVFATDSTTLSEVNDKLSQWALLEHVPKCWEVVQPFLCSVYMPKCNNDTLEVDLPSKELCQRAQDPCRIVEKYSEDGWPDFLHCSQHYFKEDCGSTSYESLMFNMTGSCNPPLIRTDNEDSWYMDIDGCGINCQNPLFTDEEHQEVHIFIAVFGSLCIMCTLFTILTFIIDWKTASRYPAVILFFINGCFFLGSLGWMAQFSGNAREDIVCRSDGTVRKGEPQLGSGETASCTIVFLLVYYFMMAGTIWFVMLAYAWDITFRTLGTVRDNLSNKTAYFHIISWCVPLVLSIVCLAISEVDGDTVSGICFVGYFKTGIRAGFVLTPMSLVLVCGLIFLLRGLFTLIKLRKNTPDFISDKATAKIRETILRLGVFALLAFTFVLITFCVHVYIFSNEDKWAQSFEEMIHCEADVSITNSTKECVLADRPSLVVTELHIFAFFGSGIAMSSWSWTRASLYAWERFLRKVFNKPSNKLVKLKKHKMIARAFEKRHQMNNGRLSISFHSTHDDPLGMKFDLNSVSSHDMSSSFAAAMPKLLRRRGGMQHPTAGTNRRYSDSDIQSIVSFVASKTSRRQSLDSQYSKYHSQTSDAEIRAEIKKKRKKRKKKRRRGRANKVLPHLAPIHNPPPLPGIGRSRHHLSKARRGSDTSGISHASAHGIQVSMDKNSTDASRPLSQNSCRNSMDDNQPMTNFAIFAAQSVLPGVADIGDLIKRHNIRTERGRATEVKLEMSERNFYRERTKSSKSSKTASTSASSRSSRARKGGSSKEMFHAPDMTVLNMEVDADDVSSLSC
ncbi:hypothetical protein ScPMuIL_007551 [Solemya velum]